MQVNLGLGYEMAGRVICVHDVLQVVLEEGLVQVISHVEPVSHRLFHISMIYEVMDDTWMNFGSLR